MKQTRLYHLDNSNTFLHFADLLPITANRKDKVLLLTCTKIGILSIQYNRLGPRPGHGRGWLSGCGSAWTTPTEVNLRKELSSVKQLVIMKAGMQVIQYSYTH